jgi:hypothetical protein
MSALRQIEKYRIYPTKSAEYERIRVDDRTSDVYWIAVEEVEDDEQLEVSTYT